MIGRLRKLSSRESLMCQVSTKFLVSTAIMDSLYSKNACDVNHD
jgi:hypothetical protein